MRATPWSKHRSDIALFDRTRGVMMPPKRLCLFGTAKSQTRALGSLVARGSIGPWHFRKSSQSLLGGQIIFTLPTHPFQKRRRAWFHSIARTLLALRQRHVAVLRNTYSLG